MADPAPEVVLEPGSIEVDIAADGKTTTQTSPQDPPAADPPAAEAPAVGVEALQSQIKALEDREAAALRERANFERVAREQAVALTRAQEDSAKARGEVVDARRSTIDSSIVAAQSEADMARRDYQLALEAGDFAKASDANMKMNTAAAKMALLNEKKTILSDDSAIRTHEGAVTQRPPSRPSSDVNSYIETKSPRTQAWLRDHPECVSDPRMNNKTVAAHYEALAEGYAPDTESYFGFIDRRLGFAGQIADADDGAVEAETTQPVRKTARNTPPAAPVSRDAPRSERTPGRMYLTRGEQEVAEALGISPSEYARRKQAMEKQGYYHT